MNACDTGSCKLSESVWALVSDTKVHRVTFSKSLVDLLAAQTGLKARRVGFVVGKKLEPG